MAQDLDFGHGKHYGDYSGVTFYGSPENGIWLDSLPISDAYIGPLFHAILERQSIPPKIVSEWNEQTGWTVTGLDKAIPPAAAIELAESLANINTDQLASFCNGCSPEECLSCAVRIKKYLEDHVAKTIDLFMEQD